MTLGEKIKEARKNAGLTQEELADKIMVSRNAVTKWEADRGMPDIENLKALAKLFETSLDHLLGDGETLDLNVIKERIDLSLYGKGLKKRIKDRLIRDKFPDAKIMTLMPQRVLTRGERIIDNLLGWLTDAPFGTPDMINSVKLLGNEFYLVVNNENQYLVNITKEFMETRRIINKVEENRGSKFQINDIIYTNCGTIIEKGK